MSTAPARPAPPLWALCCGLVFGFGCAGGVPGAASGGGSAGEPATESAILDEDRAAFDYDRTAFDYDWSVQTIAEGTAGEEVELESLRGRPLVLNFWASWCPPCVRELGSFQELKAAVAARGIEATFLFVSPEEARVAGAFVEDNGWELPFAVELRRAPPSLGDLVLPTTFIVDRRGAIALRHRGATDWNQPEVIELLASLDRGAP